MSTITTHKNETHGAVQQAPPKPDAALARKFYAVMYKHALPLLDDPKAALWYSARWMKQGDGAMHSEGIPWKRDNWTKFIDGLNGYLAQKAEAGENVIPVPALVNSQHTAETGNTGAIAFILADADSYPIETVEKALKLIGKATMLVTSGSIWRSPEGGQVPKLHFYKRLKKVAWTPEDIAKAVEAQKLFTQYLSTGPSLGADKSMTPVHPLGLPGSVNMKPNSLAVRKLIEDANYAEENAEIDLDELLAKLRAALGASASGSSSYSVKKAVADFSGEKLGVDVEKVVADLIKGDDMHGNATKLAAHYAGSGLKRQAVWDIVKGVIDGSVRDQQRKNDFIESGELKRIVDSAVDKFANGKFVSGKPLTLGGTSSFSAEFPVKELPPLMREAVTAVAGETATPVAYAAMAALASASAAVCYIADVEALASGSAAPTSLYVMNVAVSGGRKSTVDSWFRKAYDTVMRERRRAYSAALDIYKAELAVHAQDERAAIKNGGGAGAVGPKPVHPPAPGLLHSDATFEAVLRNMAEGAPYAVIWSAEAGMILGGAGFAKDRAQASVSTLNLAWDGVDIQRSRVGGSGGESAKRGEVVSQIACPRLVANLAIHPPLAREFIGSEMNSSQGLTARMLIAHPDPGIGQRQRTTKDPNRIAAVARFNHRIETLLRMSLRNGEAVYHHFNAPAPVDGDTGDTGEGGEVPETDPFGNPPGDTASETNSQNAPWNGLPILTLSSGARVALEALYDEVEPQLKAGGRLEAFAAFVSKVPEQAARIAGVLTLFENAGATEVSETTMKSAITIMRWFLDARVRFESGTDGTDFELAAKLVNWIKTNVSGDILPARDIQKEGPGKLRKAKQLDPVISILVDRGWLMPLTQAEISAGILSDGVAVKVGWRLHPAFMEAEV